MRKPSPYIEVIRKFLPEDRVKMFCGADWGRETKACKEVIMGNSLTLDEFKVIDKPTFQINSLNWFKTANGKKYIAEWALKQKKGEQLSNQLKDKTVNSYELTEQPVVVGAIKKPKTLLDFLKYGQN